MTSRTLSICVLAIAALAAAEPAAATSVRSAWDYRAADLERSNLFPAACSSTEGRVLILGRTIERDARAPVALILSADGTAARKMFPELPNGVGKARNAAACRWLADGSLLVLVETHQYGFSAIWFSPDFEMTGSLELEAKNADIQPTAIAEIRPGEFVAVGMHRLHPVALRFDRRQVERVALPWVDGPEGVLNDVEPEPQGGFSVCGYEARIEGGSVPSVETIVATFDQDGKVRAQARLPGRGCALLPSRAGKVRVLHDNGATEHFVLLLATFDAALESLSEEPLMTNFAPGMTIQAFEAREQIFFVSPWYGWETLEIRGPSGPESFDLDVSPGGVIDLLPGPSRVYLVSSTINRDPATDKSAFGLRVEAFDLELP